jgi:aspartate--ammonia ligase
MKKSVLKTEEAIWLVKQTFESTLKTELGLTKVSSPIAVLHGTGINDDLNGTERTVQFPVKSLNDRKAVIVNSLAKWKRIKLMELEAEAGEGIVTDMRAIRPDEDYSAIHSIYVDQWDWEKRIDDLSRDLDLLKTEVSKIYTALLKTEETVCGDYDEIKPILPQKIHYIHSEELLQLYPDLKPKERESKITQQYGAVFLIGIGKDLSNGQPHDGRASDYDDWSTANEDGYFGLNGDILLWNPVLEEAFEISSMGIRVDKSALERQLDIRGDENRKSLLFHQMLLSETVPSSIGGGIGQSRVCMFMLRKKHIGEVQVGIWPEEMKQSTKANGISLL